MFFDGDDVADPHLVASMHAFLERHRHLSAACPHYRAIDRHGAPHSSFGYRVAAGEQEVDSVLYRRNCLLMPGMIVRRDHLGEAPFACRYASGEDYLLWLRLRLKGRRIGVLPEPLVSYRVHQDSITGRRDATARGRHSKVIRMTALATTLPGLGGQAFACRLALSLAGDLWSMLGRRLTRVAGD
jgi:hypothetical protein